MMQQYPLQATKHLQKKITISARGMALYGATIMAPFLMAVLSLLHPRDPASRNVIWIFVIFYGAVFYIASGSGADSVRYAEMLANMHRDQGDFSGLLNSFFAEGSRHQDIYRGLLTYLVSILTDHHGLLFAAFGVLFGYAYSRNIWFLIDRIPGKITPLLIVLLAAYALHVNIGSGLNGVRMWTALHVFIFGLLHFLATQKLRFLVVMFLTPLIHFSFWLPCGLFAVYYFARHFSLAVYVFFIVSFLGAALDLATVQKLMGLLPLPIEQGASGYLLMAERAPDHMEERRAAQIWFLQLNHMALTGFFFISVSWMVWRGCLRHNGLQRQLLLFGMLAYGAINMVSYIPSLGRFYNLSEMVLLGALVLFFADKSLHKKIDRQIFYFISLLLVINIALGARFMLGYSSIWLVAGNFLVAPFVEANMSLYEVIFWLLRTVFSNALSLLRAVL